MRFRQHQDDARRATRRLLLLFALTLVLTVLAVNGALALIWKLQFWGTLNYPRWFFETNTAVTLGFVLGGYWLETLQLKDGGAHVAHLLGGRELSTPHSLTERRLLNTVEEMAIASGLKAPRVFILEREQNINALAAGWDQQDSAIAVTRGALDRLTRDELQGVIAHEFSHILNGDTRLNMRLIGMVFGLQSLYTMGRSLMEPVDDRGRRGVAVLAGVALVVAGGIGWLAGRVLKAGVSRQREHLADAYAVQFTRQPEGIGGALRKIAHQLQQGRGMQHANTELVSHLLLSSDILTRSRWLATHPPITDRLRRIYGRAVPPLPDDPVPDSAPSQPSHQGVMAFAPMDPGAPPAPHPALPHAVGSSAPPVFTAKQPCPAATDLQPGEAELMALDEYTPPTLLRATVLAFLVPGPDAPEHPIWKAQHPTPAAQPVIEAVWALPASQRQPWFERFLARAAKLGADQRIMLHSEALQLVQADGHLSLHEFLLAQLLRHDTLPSQENPWRETRRKPLAARAREVRQLTQALSTLLPSDGSAENHLRLRTAWVEQVMARLELAGSAPEATDEPAARTLAEVIERLAQVTPLARPALVKTWTLAAQAVGMPQALADALRCLCLLIDTPIPPELASLFRQPARW